MLTQDQRKARLRASITGYYRSNLANADFLRSLRLARDEGLLTELLRQIDYQDRQEALAVGCGSSDELGRKAEHETQTTQTPGQDQQSSHNASELHRSESLSQLTASASNPPALEKLSSRLFDEIDRIEAVSERVWSDLSEDEKEWYRTCTEGLIQNWALVLEAHAELVVLSTRRQQ